MTNLIKQSKMKKVITLCLFAFVMILGTESVMAQSTTPNKIEINAEASSKTEALRKYVKFTDDQRDAMYLALKEYGEGKAGITTGIASEEAKTKIEKRLLDKVKTILSEEQFDLYLAFKEQN